MMKQIIPGAYSAGRSRPGLLCVGLSAGVGEGGDNGKQQWSEHCEQIEGTEGEISVLFLDRIRTDGLPGKLGARAMTKTSAVKLRKIFPALNFDMTWS